MQTSILKRNITNVIISLSSAFALSLTTTQSLAIESTSITNTMNNQQSQTEHSQNINKFTEAELEQMLAPIALYPDSLLSHILIAATYPIEVVDAERWLEKNNQYSVQERADAAEKKDWDASVKALLPFPNILKKLSNDLHWMRNLGDAFLQDQSQVLASIQSLRQQADQAGNLDNMNNVNVVRETKTIIIKPAQPEVIYVPYYDTHVVYGHWRWSHYPPVYWQYPSHYAYHHGPYYWHNPVHLTLGLFFGNVHWHNRHVVVHHHKSRYYKHHSKKRVSTSYQGKKWQHNPRHRKGVAYRTANIQKKYRSHTPSVQHHKVARAEKAHFAQKSKYKVKQNSTLHKKVKHKLKVNQAVKVDKHARVKSSLNKTQPYQDPKWRSAKANKSTYERNSTRKVKSPSRAVNHNKAATKHVTAQKKQQLNTRHGHKQENKHFVRNKQNQKPSYRSSNKRSVAKVTHKPRTNGTRSQRSQQKKRH